MTQEWDCSDARVALGVYVLGAIDPAERALADAHLATCEGCQAELAELADLPALLALVPAEDAIALADGLPGDHLFLADDMLVGDLPIIRLPGGAADDGQPGGAIGTWGMNGGADAIGEAIAADAASVAGMGSVAGTASTAGPGNTAGVTPGGGGSREALAPVVDLAARRRQRLARAGAVAAAAVIVGAASFGGVKLAASPAPNVQITSVDSQHPNGVPITGWQTVQGANGQAIATVSYRSMGWGIQLAAKVKGIPPNTPCTMWVVKLDGSRAYAGSWITDSDEGGVWYPGSAATAATGVKAFVITISGGQEITVTPA